MEKELSVLIAEQNELLKEQNMILRAGFMTLGDTLEEQKIYLSRIAGESSQERFSSMVDENINTYDTFEGNYRYLIERLK